MQKRDTRKQEKEERLLRIKQVMERCGVSRSFIYTGAAKGTFPRPVKIGDGGRRRVAWRSSDIDRWIESLPVVTYNPDSY